LEHEDAKFAKCEKIITKFFFKTSKGYKKPEFNADPEFFEKVQKVHIYEN
jgi:hypothetical protein